MNFRNSDEQQAIGAAHIYFNGRNIIFYNVNLSKDFCQSEESKCKFLQ